MRRAKPPYEHANGYFIEVIVEEPDDNVVEVRVYCEGQLVYSCRSETVAQEWIDQEIEQQGETPSQSI